MNESAVSVIILTIIVGYQSFPDPDKQNQILCGSLCIPLWLSV
jgi:hypothetical protein